MQRPSQKTIPFARDGQKNDIPTSGAALDENASYQMGFPPRTMTNDASAVPPTGEDINGILNQLSVASIYQQAGGMYPFNGTFAQAIGGYPKGAIVLKSDGTGHWMNTVDNNLTNPDSGGTGWSDFSAKMMVGATDLTNGQSGAVPAPLIADRYKFLCGDGTWKPAQTRNLHEYVWAGLPLTDAGLHLVDGAFIPFGGMYDAWARDVERIKNAELCPDAFVTQAEFDASVSAYGSCGKFVVTSSGVRLPKVSDILQGTTDISAVGDLVEAGLPNITGRVFSTQPQNSMFRDASGDTKVEGAFSESKIVSSEYVGYAKQNGERISELVFNAYQSSPYYRDDIEKPTPQTIKSLLYICVATSVKTPVEVEIDEIATDLNGKADKDFANVTKPYIVEMGENSAGWWKIYSNGWVEQGGIAKNENASATGTTVPLTIEMSNGYSVMTTPSIDITSNSALTVKIIRSRITSISFNVVYTYGDGYVANTEYFFWKVEGWKA